MLALQGLVPRCPLDRRNACSLGILSSHGSVASDQVKKRPVGLVPNVQAVVLYLSRLLTRRDSIRFFSDPHFCPQLPTKRYYVGTIKDE